MRHLNRKVYMNGFNGEVVEYNPVKYSCYRVRFDDPFNALPTPDWWFSEAELEPHLLDEWSWFSPEPIKCTCGADSVYSMREITPYHHGQLCEKFKRAEHD